MLNSKKCSIRELAVWVILTLPLAASVSAQAAPPNAKAIRDALVSDLNHRETLDFQAMTQRWEKRYGTQAFAPLLELARSKRIQDADRYVALMSAAKIGGTASAPELVPLLSDSSWMIRAGTIRALAALKHPEATLALYPLLKDSALVVRLEAVDAIQKLQPPGAADKLLAAIDLPENFHSGKALWVPQRILSALVALRARHAVAHLLPLLEKNHDPDLQYKTIAALEQLTGKSLSKPGAALKDKVSAWRNELRRKT